MTEFEEDWRVLQEDWRMLQGLAEPLRLTAWARPEHEAKLGENNVLYGWHQESEIDPWMNRHILGLLGQYTDEPDEYIDRARPISALLKRLNWHNNVLTATIELYGDVDEWVEEKNDFDEWGFNSMMTLTPVTFMPSPDEFVLELRNALAARTSDLRARLDRLVEIWEPHPLKNELLKAEVWQGVLDRWHDPVKALMILAVAFFEDNFEGEFGSELEVGSYEWVAELLNR